MDVYCASVLRDVKGSVAGYITKCWTPDDLVRLTCAAMSYGGKMGCPQLPYLASLVPLAAQLVMVHNACAALPANACINLAFTPAAWMASAAALCPSFKDFGGAYSVVFFATGFLCPSAGATSFTYLASAACAYAPAARAPGAPAVTLQPLAWGLPAPAGAGSPAFAWPPPGLLNTSFQDLQSSATDAILANNPSSPQRSLGIPPAPAPSHAHPSCPQGATYSLFALAIQNASFAAAPPGPTRRLRLQLHALAINASAGAQLSVGFGAPGAPAPHLGPESALSSLPAATGSALPPFATLFGAPGAGLRLEYAIPSFHAALTVAQQPRALLLHSMIPFNASLTWVEGVEAEAAASALLLPPSTSTPHTSCWSAPGLLTNDPCATSRDAFSGATSCAACTLLHPGCAYCGGACVFVGAPSGACPLAAAPPNSTTPPAPPAAGAGVCEAHFGLPSEGVPISTSFTPAACSSSGGGGVFALPPGSSLAQVAAQWSAWWVLPVAWGGGGGGGGHGNCHWQ